MRFLYCCVNNLLGNLLCLCHSALIIKNKGECIVRRKDKEVTSQEWMEQVLHQGVWLELAMADTDGWPYVLPMNYGYKDGFIFVHGAREGKKIDMLNANPKVCFNITIDTEIIRNEDPSEFSMKYRSVTGHGVAHFVDDLSEKKSALQVIMNHYDGPTEPMPDGLLTATAVIKIEITEMTGKVSGYPKP